MGYDVRIEFKKNCNTAEYTFYIIPPWYYIGFWGNVSLAAIDWQFLHAWVSYA